MGDEVNQREEHHPQPRLGVRRRQLSALSPSTTRRNVATASSSRASASALLGGAASVNSRSRSRT